MDVWRASQKNPAQISAVVANAHVIRKYPAHPLYMDAPANVKRGRPVPARQAVPSFLTVPFVLSQDFGTVFTGG